MLDPGSGWDERERPEVALRLFLSAVGSLGDTNPVIALGCALRERGHDVFVLTTAEADAKVRAAGLETHVVVSQRDYDAWRLSGREPSPDDENMKALTHLVLPSIDPTVRFVWPRYRPGRSLAIAPAISGAGLLFLRERLGMPAIEVQYAPRPCPQSSPEFDRAFGPVFSAIGSSIGLRPDARDWLRWLGTFDHAIALFTDWFLHGCDTSTFIPVTPTGYLFEAADDLQPLPAELNAFLDAGDPPLAVTFGTYASNHSGLFEGVIHACAELRQRLVLITKYPEQLPSPLPGGCIAVDYVSLQRLFPRLRAVIHHAGAGTIAQAFRAGIPQIACPMAFDQFVNADRVAALGLGVRADVAELRDGGFTQALTCALSDSMLARRAREIAAVQDFGDPRERICGAIEACARALFENASASSGDGKAGAG